MLSKRYARADRGRCVACGACTYECPRGAVKILHGCFARIDAERCVGCSKCAAVCPADCITLLEREARV